MSAITVQADDLAAAVAFAAHALPRNPSLAALSGIRLTGGDPSLTISAFDFDTYMHAECVSRGPKVDLLVSGQAFARYVAGLPSGPVSIESDGRTVTVSAGRAKVTLAQLSLPDYPSAPQAPEAVASLDAAALADAVARVRPCIDPQNPTQTLRGVGLVTDDDELVVMGLDSYHTTTRRLPWTGPEVKAVVGLSGLDALKAMTGEVKVGLSEGLISLDDGHYGLTSRLIAGQQPKVLTLFASHTATHTIQVDHAALVEALRFVASGDVRTKGAGLLILDIGTDAITVNLAGAEGLDAATVVEAKVDGDPIRIQFSAAYLLDVLAATSADVVTLALDGGTRGTKLTAEDDPSVAALVMPVRLPA